MRKILENIKIIVIISLLLILILPNVVQADSIVYTTEELAYWDILYFLEEKNIVITIILLIPLVFFGIASMLLEFESEGKELKESDENNIKVLKKIVEIIILIIFTIWDLFWVLLYPMIFFIPSVIVYTGAYILSKEKKNLIKNIILIALSIFMGIFVYM